MDENFWQQRWASNEIGFHLSEANPLFVKHFKSLELSKNQRVFLPLCGKTLDIAWLLSQEYKVAGAEIVEVAIQQLFEELKVKPTITKLQNLKHYSALNLDLFVGDIFNLNPEILGPIDATYDRAALVALPKDVSLKYSQHLIRITKNAKQLLITFEYDQSLTHGPPFSVDEKEVKQYYDKTYQVTLLESTKLAEGLRGKFPAKENIWIIK